MVKRLWFDETPTFATAPTRLVRSTVLPELSDASAHREITIAWIDDETVPPGQAVDEFVLRGEPWLARHRRVGATSYKHVALAHRADGLDRSTFLERWRAHAGSVGTTPIPDQARGLAYAQNHPADERGYDAVNEVWFDDIDALATRVAWMRDALKDGPDPTLFASSTLLAVREEIVSWDGRPSA